MPPTQLNLLVGSLLLAAFPVVAQTSAPSSGPAASTGGGMGWLWIILLLALVGGAVWYFMFRNKSSATSSTGVDRDRVAGSAKQAGGSVKDTVKTLLVVCWAIRSFKPKANSTKPRGRPKTRRAASRIRSEANNAGLRPKLMDA